MSELALKQQFETNTDVIPTLNDALMRAGALTQEGFAPTLIQLSPEITGDFSFYKLEEFLGLQPELGLEVPPDSPAFTTIPDHLPSVESQEELLGTLQESEMLGDLMRQVRLSKLTGCFMRPAAARNHNGYSSVKSPAAKEIGLGTYREAHRVAHFLHLTETTGQPPAKQELKKTVDHICRNPSCCSPSHTRLLSGKENNALKDKAGKLEPIVIRGQMFYVPDLFPRLPWLEQTIIHEDGEIPERVISTRLGPFALRAALASDALVYGQRLSCDVYDSLREPGKNNYIAPSRAKPFKPQDGDHLDIFHKNRFKKKHIPTKKELYEAAMGH